VSRESRVVNAKREEQRLRCRAGAQRSQKLTNAKQKRLTYHVVLITFNERIENMSYAIETQNLTMEFKLGKNVVKAVDNLSFAVEEGRVFGFLGPNGAGKSTVMHILLGFLKPTSGVALINGSNVLQNIARQHIGYLPEHPETYKFLTGRELLINTANLFNIKKSHIASKISDLLKLVNLDDSCANRKIVTYSRGMMQRICLAQALINEPSIVILDEPTNGLDPLGRETIRQIIADLKAEGKTVFFSSHELSEVSTVCDEISIMVKGKIKVEGDLKELVPDNKDLQSFFMEVISDE
jgi:ABC-2 type transport system ATP-binding protein